MVSQCETGTLFEDLLQSKERAKAQSGHTHTESDLIKHVDNYLKAVKMPLSTKQFYESIERERVRTKGDKKKRAIIFAKSQFNKDKYKKIIELAKEDWLLSTDGVVKALRYDKQVKQFVAKVHYKKGNDIKKEHITVSDDWVFDTYGKDIANKLMDRGEHSEFIKPVNEDGRPIVLKLDQRKIQRVKYYPAKFIHKMDDQGKDQRTEEVYAKGTWSGQLDDGTVTPVPENLVTAQFGSKFVEECKRLGQRKFVPIPVGSC